MSAEALSGLPSVEQLRKQASEARGIALQAAVNGWPKLAEDLKTRADQKETLALLVRALGVLCEEWDRVQSVMLGRCSITGEAIIVSDKRLAQGEKPLAALLALGEKRGEP